MLEHSSCSKNVWVSLFHCLPVDAATPKNMFGKKKTVPKKRGNPFNQTVWQRGPTVLVRRGTPVNSNTNAPPTAHCGPLRSLNLSWSASTRNNDRWAVVWGQKSVQVRRRTEKKKESRKQKSRNKVGKKKKKERLKKKKNI